MVLEGYKPENVMKYFEEITTIPHGSGNTKAISDYIVNIAKENGLKYIQDEYNNVIVIKEAQNASEKAEPVMLQAHIDMVCEKKMDTEGKFNFKTDALKLAVMDDYVYAKGTTLGGDDGIGVAFMLAVLTDKEISTPKLECVFTSDEEIGMIGAQGIDVSGLESKKLINLDHEAEGILLTSCAGGRKTMLSLPVRRVERKGTKYTLVICGLSGGHSGTEIDKYKGNANLIMGRLLHYLGTKVYYELINVDGGLADNAISRECRADILINDKDSDILEGIVSEFEDTIKNEYRSVEKNLMIYCENQDEEAEKVLTPQTKDKVIFLLMTLPDGVYRMSTDVDGLVQTSSNVGIIRLLKDKFEAILSVRSSLTSEKQALCDKIKYLIETIGGTYKEDGDYPAWEYRADSELREITASCIERMYGKRPEMIGIHAGLETGVFYQKIKGLDIVVMGPDVEDIHTPKEKMNLPSVERVYNVLVEVLRELSK